MRNQYPGRCGDCNCWVEAGARFFEIIRWKNRTGPKKWKVRCMKCVAGGREAAGKSLSYAQAAAIKDAER
jgi:hypothetical protein